MAEANRAPPPAPAPASPSAEVARLRALLEADPGGTTAVLRGPRGVGKGAVAAEVATAARALPGTVVFESTAQAVGGRSFQPFAELVGQAVSWAEQARLADALVDPLLGDLAPVLDPDSSEGAPAPSLDQKLRFFDAARRLLSGVAERARLLLVVHDLDRAGGDALELARYLADHLFEADPHAPPRKGGLLLLVLRDDAGAPERARDLLLDLEEHGAVAEVRLSGLDLQGLRRYLERSPHLARVLEASAGVPHEVDALFEALPTNVEQLFERRLSELGALERRVLQALSLSSRPASARTLAVVLSAPAKEVASALAAQRGARVLERRIVAGEPLFTFARQANQEVTARGITAEDRAALHDGWVRALCEPGVERDLALLAHHQLRASEPQRAVSTALTAAEAHAVAGALDAASTLLAEALPHAEAELRPVLACRLSELASLRAQPREAMRWLELWKAEAPARDARRVWLREAELHNALGDHDGALAAAEAGLAVLEPHQRLERAALEGARAEALYQRGQLDEARARAAEAVRTLDEHDDGARAALLHLQGKIAARRGDFAEAAAHFIAALALARRAHLPREEARGLVNLGFVQLRTGDLDAAETSLAQGVEVARAVNDLAHRAHGELNLGVVAHLRDRVGVALERYAAARALFRALGNTTQRARVEMNLALAYLGVGAIARARLHVDAALRLCAGHGAETVRALVWVAEASVLAAEGQHERALARLREVPAHERTAEVALDVAEIELRSGEAQAARAAIATAEEALGRAHATGRLALRARALDARAVAALDPAEGAAAIERVLASASDTPRAWRAALEQAWALAELALGRDAAAREHLAIARRLDQARTAELPPALRETFEHTGDRAERAQLWARLEPDAPAPSTPPPTPRTEAWDARYGALVGGSPKLLRVFRVLDRLASSDDTVLITGESGTGKELVAEAVHRGSSRAGGPFVRLNCAALVESLLLSELFGHERGAFTGAHQRKVGRFELAAGGTIFLDEIGDISAQTQVSLLRVLQAREFERVGGGRPIRLDARVICATNRDLARMVREGTFREDLYYRLKALSVELPSLRERPEDLPLLARHFLERYARETGTPAKALSPAAAERLARHGWPGNVRELENVIRSVALFVDGPRVEVAHLVEHRALFEDPSMGDLDDADPTVVPAPEAPNLGAPPDVHATGNAPHAAAVAPAAAPTPRSSAEKLTPIFEAGASLDSVQRRLQEDAIARALTQTRGNITHAAALLGMKRPRLSQIIGRNAALKALCKGVSR